MTTFIEVAPLYEYERNGKTWLIEAPPIGEPVLVKSDSELRERLS